MKSKIISFIIGGLIGFAMWSVQVKAWGAELPIGYAEMQTYEVADPEEYMETHYVDITDEVIQASERYGEEYGICPEILEALAWRESRCRADVKNGSCIGVAQINAKVHKDRIQELDVDNIYDVDGNIKVACDYLSDLEAENHNIAKSLDDYNGNGKNGRSNYARQIFTVAYCLDMTGGD